MISAQNSTRDLTQTLISANPALLPGNASGATLDCISATAESAPPGCDLEGVLAQLKSPAKPPQSSAEAGPQARVLL